MPERISLEIQFVTRPTVNARDASYTINTGPNVYVAPCEMCFSCLENETPVFLSLSLSPNIGAREIRRTRNTFTSTI